MSGRPPPTGGSAPGGQRSSGRELKTNGDRDLAPSLLRIVTGKAQAPPQVSGALGPHVGRGKGVDAPRARDQGPQATHLSCCPSRNLTMASLSLTPRTRSCLQWPTPTASRPTPAPLLSVLAARLPSCRPSSTPCVLAPRPVALSHLIGSSVPHVFAGVPLAVTQFKTVVLSRSRTSSPPSPARILFFSKPRAHHPVTHYVCILITVHCYILCLRTELPEGRGVCRF